ncbi:hypothetical protein [Acaryochloris sp. IP29b_bin.137]|uniref:hypothetical protein n=1 Tax=Acaryochloris sp. IP29b_bin.137 TaxID=2969217 RepID=UPI002628826C|nr:hypothetical protein [Acaryochloris sp. IP29b_bin.137]
MRITLKSMGWSGRGGQGVDLFSCDGVIVDLPSWEGAEGGSVGSLVTHYPPRPLGTPPGRGWLTIGDGL